MFNRNSNFIFWTDKKIKKVLNELFLTIIICMLIACFSLIFDSQHAFASTETTTLEHKIDAYIAQYEDTISGLATIVIQDNEMVIHRTKGYADIEQGIKVDNETVFEWGSSSKILVWISVMQLVEEGLIDLKTDIRQYLPQDFNYPTPFDKPITMTHLMNHQAGFDDSYTDLMVLDPNDKISLRHALEHTDVQQVFPPGEVVAYSNYSSALAAYIVEEISGVDYREYVKENIFTPLGMVHTSIDPRQEDNLWVKAQREKIQGYTTDKELIYPNYYTIPIYPAGSVIGTADDFAKLLKALLSENGNLLFNNQNTIKLMFEPTAYFPKTDISRVAHGLFSLPARSQVYGHGGNTLAFSSSIYIDRENQLGVVVMANQSGETNFSLGIPELIFGKPAYINERDRLEDSSVWEGIYQPARLPYHGFSKIYGLLQRSSVKQQGNHDLVTNKLDYTQESPGIYVTEDDFSIFSVDIYSTHPTYKKILSSAYSDLIEIPLYRHLFEICLLCAGAIAILFSLISLFIRLVKVIWKRQITASFTMMLQHILNTLMVFNVGWMINKALSMATYHSLKIHFLINIIFLVGTIVLCGYRIVRRKTYQPSKIHYMTIILSLILCANLLYWEFYH